MHLVFDPYLGPFSVSSSISITVVREHFSLHSLENEHRTRDRLLSKSATRPTSTRTFLFFLASAVVVL
jgi:hypothetical protein